MAAGWKLEVLREHRVGGRYAPRSRFIVALSDQMGATLLLKSKEGLLAEEVEVIGEADQAVLDRWHIKPGAVFCVADWL